MRIDCSFETIIGTQLMYSSMVSGLTIEIIEPMLKTPFSVSLRNLINRTLFDVEL